jgi:uncharacterized protein YndB with AHSA1/START domain
MPVSHTTVELEEKGGSTLFTTTTTYDSPEGLKQVLEMGMEEGYRQTLDRLETLVTA